MGYNVIKGNPDNEHDPGFAFSVLNFTSVTNSTTSDGKFLVPDHVQALQTKSCSFESQVATEFGSRSYQDALSVDVAVEAGVKSWVWGARFTASSGYKKVSEGTTQRNYTYTSATAKCIQYELSVNYADSAINVTGKFAQAVHDLPLERDSSEAYKTFIDNYGTHFTIRVTMGAKMVVISEFDQQALITMEKKGLNIQVAAQLSFTKFSSQIASETETERQQRETFETMRRWFQASYQGSHPPPDGRWESWAESSGNSPYPVRYMLAPIASLFTAKFFPNMPSSERDIRRTLLSLAYETYCIDVPGCRIPPEDKIPTRLTKVTSTSTGSVTVYCPPMERILACGISSVGEWEDYAQRRVAYQESNSQCTCTHVTRVECVAWCTPVTSSPANAYCPARYKMLLMVMLVMKAIFH